MSGDRVQPSAVALGGTVAPGNLQIAGVTHREANLGGGVRLHYVEAGGGEGRPVVVLLHGFPEFWYSWRHQIPALVAAGHHVVVPDMRGYNLSDKPRGWRAYRPALLAGDVLGLIEHIGEGPVDLVGHDWGGAVAYYTVMEHPGAVRRVAILNVPHPARMAGGLRSARQLRKSWYMLFFQLPRLPEWLMERDGCSFAKRALGIGPGGAFAAADLDAYVAAWSQPGAMEGMINYYRAALRQDPRRMGAGRMRRIEAPVVVIWGERDPLLGRELAEPSRRLAGDVTVHYITDGGHFIQNERPRRVNELLIDFLG